MLIGTGESVADILNFGKEYIQVNSPSSLLNFPSTKVLPFCLFFFRLLNGNELRAIPDGAFRNLKDLKYMYVSYFGLFSLVFLCIITHGNCAAKQILQLV